jgi:hypothetical protein
MERKRIILAFALICSATFCGRALAADPAASCAATTVAQQEIGNLLSVITAPPAWELKVTCLDPHCVTNQDCINRPPGDAGSTCEYGKLPAPPPGCGTCYY